MSHFVNFRVALDICYSTLPTEPGSNLKCSNATRLKRWIKVGQPDLHLNYG